MWITLQNKHINFNVIENFYRKDKALYLTSIGGKVVYFIYPTGQKCKQVLEYLKTTLAIKDSEIT
jgi:hypothetical protein